MSQIPSLAQTGETFRIQDFPALASLRLGDEDLKELTGQGFVGREIRQGNVYFKLRFRRGGRQLVRHIRAHDVTAVQTELDQLQAASRLTLKLDAASREARRILRQTKPNLLPVLQSHGFTFHGLAIRQRRINQSKCNTLNGE